MNLLTAFRENSSSTDLALSVSASSKCLGQDQWVLNFWIVGDLNEIKLPLPISGPVRPGQLNRKDELWKSTCFEAFFSSIGKSEYLEINANTSGFWNAYVFDSYRSGMRPLEGISLIHSKFEFKDCRTVQAQFTFSLESPLRNFFSQKLDLSYTSVIEDKNGGITHWAIRHCGQKPDFHLRESFVLSFETEEG